MPALVTRKFRVHNAKQFKESIDESAAWGGSGVTGSEDVTTLDEHYYTFVGRTTVWDDDNAPPEPIDTTKQNTYDPWDTMIAAKKITSADVSHVIPRYNWTSGTVYTQYNDNDHELYTNTASPMIVMTQDFNVYKCMDNANNSLSTSQPISVSTESGAIDDKYGQDNYKWKYLYTITAAEALKFVTPNYIPVKTIRNANSIGMTGTTGMPTDDGSAQFDIEKNSVDGSIDVYEIINAGGNYQFFNGTCLDGANDSSTTQIVTTTTGINQTNDVYNNSGVYVNNVIRKITDYSYDVGSGKGTLTLDSALSTPATGAFSIFPQVKIYGDGNGASARCVEGATGGTIGAVFSGDVGSNYGQAEVKVIQPQSSGAGAVIKPIISPKGGHGYNLVEECGGNFLMINTRLEQSEGGKFTTSNDFRQIGVVKSPISANGTHRFVATAGTQALTIRIGTINGSNFIADNVIVGASSGAQAKIVDVTDVTVGGIAFKDLRCINVDLGPSDTNKILGNAETNGTDMTNPAGGSVSGLPGGFQQENVSCSGSSAVITSITAGEMKPYSGSLLYVENRSPIARAADQTEDIKLIIEF